MTKFKPDALRSTVAYLRLWKICDVQLSYTRKYDSSRVFDVIPLDEGKLLNELRGLSKSELVWAADPESLREDINIVLEVSTKPKKTEKDLAALAELRKKFQDSALKYSGDIELAGGTSAAGAD